MMLPSSLSKVTRASATSARPGISGTSNPSSRGAPAINAATAISMCMRFRLAWGFRLSLLAGGAIEGGAPALHDAGDGLSAHPAVLRLAPVNLPAMLEIAKLAIHLHVIAQGRPARLDGAQQHGANFGHQCFHPV